MQYTHLGHSGLLVSRLCLGTMNFGPQTDEPTAYKIMDAALDAGLTFFDTANVYGGWGDKPEKHPGWTEEIIGRWFALGGGRRETVVLATKLNGTMQDPTLGPNDRPGYSAYKIKRAVEASLRRLQTDHIELYQMHHIDPHAPWDEVWGAYEDLITAGKVVYAGSSNFGARHLCWAQAAAANRHFLGLVSEQHRYSLLTRQPELEVLPAALELGLGVIAWSPLAAGLLGGHALDGQGGERSSSAAASLDGPARARLERFHALAKDAALHPANLALAWTLVNPAMTAPIIGPRSVEQLNQMLEVPGITLDSTLLKALDELFPGPGDPGSGADPASREATAPWAYAW
ncbi:MAG: aldo/keto reductase [Bifidobacteriaceae bacterium]|jgi:aryl-alcohol dehydrogenase-like predicted oxidoreductase|nr:aldo/keto reductase [Bifidobacteriaceae bacterium]